MCRTFRIRTTLASTVEKCIRSMVRVMENSEALNFSVYINRLKIKHSDMWNRFTVASEGKCEILAIVLVKAKAIIVHDITGTDGENIKFRNEQSIDVDIFPIFAKRSTIYGSDKALGQRRYCMNESHKVSSHTALIRPSVRISSHVTERERSIERQK